MLVSEGTWCGRFLDSNINCALSCKQRRAPCFRVLFITTAD